MQRFEVTADYFQQEATAAYGSSQRYLNPGWYVLIVDQITEPVVYSGRETQRIIFKEETSGLSFPYFHTSGYEVDSDRWKCKTSCDVVKTICRAAGVAWTGAEAANCKVPAALIGKKIFANLTTRESKKVTVDPVTMQNVERVYINNDFSKDGTLPEVIKPIAQPQTAAAVSATIPAQEFNFTFNG